MVIPFPNSSTMFYFVLSGSWKLKLTLTVEVHSKLLYNIGLDKLPSRLNWDDVLTELIMVAIGVVDGNLAFTSTYLSRVFFFPVLDQFLPTKSNFRCHLPKMWVLPTQFRVNLAWKAEYQIFRSKTGIFSPKCQLSGLKKHKFIASKNFYEKLISADQLFCEYQKSVHRSWKILLI